MNLKWKKTAKRICAGISTACLCVSGLTAMPVRAEETEAAMGRYLESEITLPENFYLQDVLGTADGRLQVIGTDENGMIGIWDSSDEGATWEETATLPEEYQDQYFTELKLNPSGGGVGVEMVSSAEESSADGMDNYEYYFVSFDAEGNAQKTLLTDEESFMLRFAGTGELIGLTYGGTAYLLDNATGEVLSTIADADADAVGIAGSEALLLTATEVQRYQISTGEPVSRDDALNDALYADGASYAVTTSAGFPIVFAQDEEGRLYYATAKGIFSHMMDGTAVEQVVDGTLCSLSDPSNAMIAMAVLNQKFFMGYADGEGSCGLRKYEYSADVSSVPSTELTLYSLKEDTGIQQAIAQYQKSNPDIYINYKVGMTGTDGITVSDALRTLNTDILAGNGPDILVMDGMSVKTYSDKGMLMDLSSVQNELKETDGVLENIAGTYQQEDGTIPAIPAKFGIPMIAGAPELIDQVDGLDSLIELAKNGDDLAPYDICILPEILYPICAGSWKNEDNTIDQEKLAEYVNTIKQVSDNFKASASSDKLEQMSWFTEESLKELDNISGVFIGDLSMGILDLLTGNIKVTMGALTDITTYAGYSAVNVKNGNCSVRRMNGQASNVFIPNTILGVLNTSANQEQAAAFLKYMLSADGEMLNKYNGFPVNQKAFDSIMDVDQYMNGKEFAMSVASSNNETGEMISLDYSWPTEEEINDLKTIAASLTVCADSERVQKDTVISEVRRC
ncbi:MAG: extracellular solute-binding protein, partial [Lachnospiraceae bacterium]|nr:extracellular solute-binding protein [Lachnospiraceae bacterium]